MGAKPLRTLQSQKDAWLAKASATGGKRNELCRVPKKRSHVLPISKHNRMGIDTPGLYPQASGEVFRFELIKDEKGVVIEHRFVNENFKTNNVENLNNK